MTYFATPTDRDAYIAGMSTTAYEAQQDAIVADLEALDAMGQPHLDPEDRDYVAEGDVALVSAQDRADLAWLDDMAAFGGFHNP